jgi:hypothetical protein
MDVLFAAIMGVLCGLVGLLGAGGIGWVVLEFCGVGRRNYRALKLAALIFGLPAGLLGFWIGYGIGATMVPQETLSPGSSSPSRTVS